MTPDLTLDLSRNLTLKLGGWEGVAAAVAGASVAAVWQGALLVMAVGVCVRLLPGLSARVRWSLWLATFAAAALLPVAALLHADAAVKAGVPGYGFTGYGFTVASRWALWMGAAWVGISLYRGVRLLREFVRMQGIAGRAKALEGMAAAGGLGSGAGGRLPEICCSTEVTVPCVAGLIKPKILLPPGLVENGTDAELRQIVLHEAEHLRRHDLWVNLMQKLALALFPLNPALLWVDRRLSSEREMACDDEVLRATGARKAYATCLANLAETSLVAHRASLALGALARRSELARRVTRILGQPKRELGRLGSAVVACGVTAGLAVAMVGLSRVPPVVGFRGDDTGMEARNGFARTQAAVGGIGERRLVTDAVANVAAGMVPGTAVVALTSAKMPAERQVDAVLRRDVLRRKSAVAVRTRRRLAVPAMRQVAWPSRSLRMRERAAGAVVPVMWREAGLESGSGLDSVGGVRQPVLLTSPDLRFTYAAVPVQDGWIFVQL